MKLEWGNIPQWLSAVCALALAILAFYGLFFSKTSQALVAYLQSELAVRNQRIAGLELREQQLQLSITQTQSTLGSLNNQKAGLDRQISELKDQQEALLKKADTLGSTLSTTEFSLVREKIGAKLASTIINPLSLTLDSELWTQGVKARTVRPWSDYLPFIKRTGEGLGEGDRALAKIVVERFIETCGGFAEAVIRIPAFPPAKSSEIPNGSFMRDDHPSARKLDAYVNQIKKIQNDIERCFNSTTPK